MPRWLIRRRAIALALPALLAAGVSACGGDGRPQTAGATSGTSSARAGFGPASRRLAVLTSSDIREFDGSLRVGNLVYFDARQKDGRHALWRTDGTTEGTIRLATVPGRIPRLTALGSKVLFRGGDRTHGREPWVSDGTASGTLPLRDLNAGSSGSDPSPAAVLGVAAYFTARTPEPGLWRTDGTASGTQLVRRLPSTATDVAAAGDRIYLAAQRGRSHAVLWSTAGSPDDLTTVAEWDQPSLTYVHLAQLTPIGTRLFYVVSTYDSGEDTDTWSFEVASATSSARRLLHLSAAAGDEEPLSITAIGSELFVERPDGATYRTDGTPAGTRRLTGLGPAPHDVIAFGNRLYYVSGSIDDGRFRLQRANPDGTHTETIREFGSFEVSSLVPGPRHVYFVEWRTEGQAVWRTDGTAAGTREVSPAPTSGDGTTVILGSGPSCAYWLWSDGAGAELWRSLAD